MMTTFAAHHALALVAGALWRGVVVLFCAWLAVLALRRGPAAARHQVWLLGMVGLLALPVAGALAPRWSVSVPLPGPLSAVLAATGSGVPEGVRRGARERTVAGLPEPQDVEEPYGLLDAGTGAPSPEGPGPGAVPRFSSSRDSWLPPAPGSVLLLAWAAGAALLLLRLLFSVRSVARLERRLPDFASPRVREFARRLARDLEIRRPVRLVRGPADAMPVGWGMLRPVVLLPAGAERWPAARLTSVLLHELTHARRRDCLSQAVAEVALALHWPNPLAWTAARRLRVEREHACDDAVLLRGARPSDYARDLLSLARELRTLPSTVRTAVPMARASSLGGRLRAVLRGPRARQWSRRRTLAAVAAAAAAVVLVAGCDPAPGPAAGTGDAPRGTPHAIEESPILAVGEVEGDTLELFSGVRSPFLLPDGRLVVPVGGSGTLRVFGPDGRFLAAHGRPGDGPGEFASLTGAWARGDTLEAMDSRRRRITRFLPDGSAQVVTLRGGGPDLSIAGAAGQGWIVGGVASAGYGRRDEIVFHRFARDGTLLGEVARLEGMARYQTPEVTGPEPLSPTALFAASRGRVYVAESLTPRIVAVGSEGEEAREVTWTPEPPPLSPAEAFRLVVETAVERAGADRAAATRRRLEAAPVPERLSVFWKFLVDDEGFTWVRDFEPLRDAAALGGLGYLGVGRGGRWTILSPEGVEVGEVEVPDRLEPTHVTPDAVVGVWTDELGVESVRVLALRRR